MNKPLAVLAALTLLAAALSMASAQTSAATAGAPAGNRHTLLAASGHPPVTPEQAGAQEKIRQARTLLDDAKRELARDGAYDCCIKDPCDRCALDHQSCPCADQVKAGKSVCPDCYAGWQRGDGVVKGVKANKVRMGTHSHKH